VHLNHNDKVMRYTIALEDGQEFISDQTRLALAGDVVANRESLQIPLFSKTDRVRQTKVNGIMHLGVITEGINKYISV
jgi:hypothetical protein